MDYTIADRLIELRKENGYSQDELAEKLNISRQAISKWERAESLPDTENLIALSRLYNVTLDELVNASKAKPEKTDAQEPVYNAQSSAQTTVNNSNPTVKNNSRLLNIILSIIGLALAITALALIAYFISEIVEVAGGYYDHMGSAYVRHEIIGYSIGLAFSVLGLATGIILGVMFFKKYRKFQS